MLNEQIANRLAERTTSPFRALFQPLQVVLGGPFGRLVRDEPDPSVAELILFVRPGATVVQVCNDLVNGFRRHRLGDRFHAHHYRPAARSIPAACYPDRVNVTPWMPTEDMEDDLTAPVLEAEDAALAILLPALALGHDEGEDALPSASRAVTAILGAAALDRLWRRAATVSVRDASSHWAREARREGLDIGGPALDQVANPWRRENVDRYGLLRDKMSPETLAFMRRQQRAGVKSTTIANNLAAFGLPTHNGRMRGRARIIAGDQLHTLAGLIASVQQRDAGIGQFIWRTKRDSRVRESHADVDGNVYAWEKPPGFGYPGQPINCRCAAEGVTGR